MTSFNWSDVLLVFTIPTALIVAIILALTGYGWGSLGFLIGIPLSGFIIGKVLDR
jgi:hypothetical protein